MDLYRNTRAYGLLPLQAYLRTHGAVRDPSKTTDMQTAIQRADVIYDPHVWRWREKVNVPYRVEVEDWRRGCVYSLFCFFFQRHSQEEREEWKKSNNNKKNIPLIHMFLIKPTLIFTAGVKSANVTLRSKAIKGKTRPKIISLKSMRWKVILSNVEVLFPFTSRWKLSLTSSQIMWKGREFL